jgi:hypothetical protein
MAASQKGTFQRTGQMAALRLIAVVTVSVAIPKSGHRYLQEAADGIAPKRTIADLLFNRLSSFEM